VRDPVARIDLGPEQSFPCAALAPAGPDDHVHRVAELIPPFFDRYLRIFHPFLPSDTNGPDETLPPGPVRTWASLAEEAGAVFHPEIVWYSLLPALGGRDGPRRYGVTEGNLDDPARSSLFRRLADAAKGQSLFFYYDLAAIVRGGVPLLYQGRADTNIEVQKLADADVGASLPGPEFLWPADRSWVVNTDYDLTSTYVGCNAALAEAILADPTLEALEVSLTTRVDSSADKRNPEIPFSDP
jgi:hypothetical protein